MSNSDHRLISALMSGSSQDKGIARTVLVQVIPTAMHSLHLSAAHSAFCPDVAGCVNTSATQQVCAMSTTTSLPTVDEETREVMFNLSDRKLNGPLTTSSSNWTLVDNGTLNGDLAEDLIDADSICSVQTTGTSTTLDDVPNV